MSKTFGQLKAGDEVYIIKGSDVEIAEVSVAAPSKLGHTLVRVSGCVFPVPSLCIHQYIDMVGDIYCDIDEAMRRMQDICAKALHDYREASGALNLLETSKNRI